MELERMLKALGEPMRLKIFLALLEAKALRALAVQKAGHLGTGNFPAHEGSGFGVWRKIRLTS